MKPSRFFLGLILILAGTVFFLINQGYGSWSILRFIPQFFPVLLIVLGLSLLWKGPIPLWFGCTLIVVVTTLVIFLFMTTPDYTITQKDFWKETEFVKEMTITKEEPDLSSGELTAQFNAGRLLLEQTANASWFEGCFSNEDVTFAHRVKDDKLSIDLRAEQKELFTTSDENLWQLALSPHLIWNLHLMLGAAESELNLFGAPLDEVRLELGAGDAELFLGQNGPRAKIKINAGASHIKMTLPQEDGVRIKVSGALKSTNLDRLNLLRRGSDYISPNYETAKNKVDVDLNLAVGYFELAFAPQKR